MARQGFKRRLDSHSERELLDHLEIADEFPGTVVGPRGSNECARGLLIRLCKSCAKTNQGGCCAGRSKSVEQQPQPPLQAEWGNLIQGRFDVRSDGSSHQHVGTEPRAAKRGYGLEPLLREHGCSAMFGLIS